MAYNPVEEMTIEQKIVTLGKESISMREAAALLGWSVDKAYKVVRKMIARGIDLTAEFEPQKVDLDAFLGGLKTTRHKMLANLQSSRAALLLKPGEVASNEL